MPDDDIHRLRENCRLLSQGYDESIDYKVQVAYHRNHCKYYAKSTLAKDDCDCPVVNESRTRKVKRPGLLKQLAEYQQNKDVDRNPKAARGAPRVKTPKTHPELAGFFALDEISCDINMTVDRALEAAGRDRTWAAERSGAVSILDGLPDQVKHWRVSGAQEVIRELTRRSDRWVAMARSALKINVADSIFGGTVCGNCGGGLSVPASLAVDHAPAVRCVGTPAEPPCGHEYPMSEWITLYQGMSHDR